MQNSSSKQKQVISSGLLVMMMLQSLSLSGDQEFSVSNEDMVSIHADKAWEDIEPDTAQFAGHFNMRVRDMQLTAERATLHGNIDDPDRVVLNGSPARIKLSHTVRNRKETVQAEAQEIVYERESAMVRLTGGARLSEGDNVLFSNSIAYEIKTDRFRSEGDLGVQIKVPPQP